MTAYQLRHHLAEGHDLQLRGAAWDTLVFVHDLEHRDAAPDHNHQARG